MSMTGSKLLSLTLFFLSVSSGSPDNTVFSQQKQRPLKKVALTFDACPAPTVGGYDSSITRILVKENIPATLFLSGRWVRNHPRQTFFLASFSQFEIANHSYSHPHMRDVNDSLITVEFRKTQDLIWKIAKRKPALFRPPYGEYDERIEKLAGKSGLKLVEYDLASGDPDTTISTKRLVRYVISKTRDGSIVVMHINGRGRHTAEALPEIISGLKAKGFEFVKVSDLNR